MKDFSLRSELKKRAQERHERAVMKKDFFETLVGSHAFHPLQDQYIESHFLAWVADTIPDEDRDEVVLLAGNLLAEEPDLVRDHSWCEIVRMTGHWT